MLRRITTIDSEGNIRIPRKFRQLLGLSKNEHVALVFADGKIYIESLDAYQLCPYCSSKAGFKEDAIGNSICKSCGRGSAECTD